MVYHTQGNRLNSLTVLYISQSYTISGLWRSYPIIRTEESSYRCNYKFILFNNKWVIINAIVIVFLCNVNK